LVADFVAGTEEPDEYVAGLAATAAQYDGFNLVVGSLWDGIAYYSNRGGAPHRLQPGVHGLSNHLLNSPWPKVERGKAGLLDLLAAPAEELVPALFALLEDQTPPPDHLLPDTGVGHAWERILSTAFIRAADYGTRCTTVILADATGQVRFIEDTHALGATPAQRREYAFRASPSSATAAPRAGAGFRPPGTVAPERRSRSADRTAWLGSAHSGAPLRRRAPGRP
jgi:uncharacterized protein with NRDE domain